MDRCDICIGGILRTMFSGGVGGMSLWIDVMFVLEVYWRSRWYVTVDICDICIGGILRTMFSGGVGGMSLWIDVMFVLEVY